MELIRKQGFNHLKVEEKDQSIELTVAPSGASIPASLGMSVLGLSQGPSTLLQSLPPQSGAVPPPPSASSGTTKAFSSGHMVKSPFVGTFYRSASPGADAFAEVGMRVKKGQTLCIVEAMKLMNEIESDRDGVIREILIENGQPVEFDQALFVIE